MGITGLLPFLEKSSRKTNIKEFSGGAVAIDSYCWLHKGAFSCAEKLAMGQATNAYVSYCIKYINMLLSYKIKPILVFDGRRLPAKEQTEIKRRISRQTNYRKAVELIKMGQVAEGKNLLKRAIDITHEMALELIKYCQNENIDCITAPYEADAQLAYLNITGIVDVVVTEDSDLTLFGCTNILFKMDFNGNGVLIQQDRLHLAMNMTPEQFDMDKFRHICILSGCDYLPSLPGIGLGKARKFITRNTDNNIHRALTRLGSVLNMKSLVVSQEYRDAFMLADIAFKHQLVFCPLQRKQVRLNPPPTDITEDQLQYAGKELDVDIAFQLALGNCDPVTLKMLHDFNPDKMERKRKRDTKIEQTAVMQNSIWSSKYKLVKSQIKSYENSLIITRKQFGKEKKCLNDTHALLNAHNGSIEQNDKLPEDQDLNKTTILDMYDSNKDIKLISNNKESDDYLSLAKNNTSPELFRQKNPFIKRTCDLTTSPSVLSNGNCRKRGRNLMRIRRTIVDENAVIESKYFLNQDNKQNKEHNEFESNIDKINKIEINSKNIKCNTIPSINTNIHDISQERLENQLSITNIAQNVSLIENIDNTILPNQTDLINCRNHEKSNSNIRINTDISSITHSKIETNDISDESSNSNIEVNDITNYKSINDLQNDLIKWSNIENDQKSCKNDRSNEQNSTKMILQSNSARKKKRWCQNKQLPSVSKQQSLLSMYGFQKRASLKH